MLKSNLIGAVYKGTEHFYIEEHFKNINSSIVYIARDDHEIFQFKEFFIAENYHQDYYNLNPNQSYCSYIISPKLEKFKKVFVNKLKK